MTDTTDVLVLAPHPDDAEMSCGGSILRLVAGGARVVIADMTRGEKATRGTPEERRAECEAATTLLGIAERINLGLPDAELRDDEACLGPVIELLRRLRPGILLAPLDRDLHPDHEATGRLARRAWFHGGLVRFRPELGAPHRPRLLLHYPLHHDVAPTLCVDISAVAERKLEAVRCYATQFGGTDRAHLARLDPLERAQARDRYYGAQIGCLAAEPFWVDGPLPLEDLRSLV